MPEKWTKEQIEQHFRGMTNAKGLVIKRAVSVIKAVDKENLTVDFVISTGDVDRDKDTIDPKGWVLKHFKKNPVVLWAHDHHIPAIGRAPSVKVQDGKLVSLKTEFTDEETNPFGKMVFNLLAGGFLNTTSVGFIANKFEINNERGGIDFKEQELMEFSVVNVPANPEALIGAAAKKIDLAPLNVWCREKLDNWQEEKAGLMIPRNQIEQVYKYTKEGAVTYHFATKEMADDVIKTVRSEVDAMGENILGDLKKKMDGLKAGDGTKEDVEIITPKKKGKGADQPVPASNRDVKAMHRRMDKLFDMVNEIFEALDELQDVVSRAIRNSSKVPHGADTSQKQKAQLGSEAMSIIKDAIAEALEEALKK